LVAIVVEIPEFHHCGSPLDARVGGARGEWWGGLFWDSMGVGGFFPGVDTMPMAKTTQ